MTKLLTALFGLGLALLGLAAAAKALIPAPFDPVAYEKAQIAIDQARAVAPAQIAASYIFVLAPAVAVVVALVLLTAWGSVALLRFRHERRPDARGLLPVDESDLGVVAPRALGAFHAARQIEASQQPVPHTITYSPSDHYAPSYDYRSERLGVPELPAGEPAPAKLPDVTDLATIPFQPTKERILLGLGAGGDLVTVPATALCHVALVGATGGGKSNLLRLLLPQLQAIGAKVTLADPHFAPVDPESGEDWREIAARLHLAPAITPTQIAALFSYLTDELERRLTMRHEGQKWGAPLFLALDELPVIADGVTEALPQLGKLLREGRKVGMYVVGASQSMLVKVVGGDSSVREAYRTAFYVGGDLKSASVLLDMPQAKIDESALGEGVALLRSKATSPARLVRVPYASNRAIAGLLTDTAPTMPRVRDGYTDVSNETGESAPRTRHVPVAYTSPDDVYRASESATAPDAETMKILARFTAGATLQDVIADVAGTSNPNSRAYRSTRERIEGLLRGQIEKGANL